MISILGLVASDEDFNLQEIVRHKISYNIIYPELNRPWNYYFNDAFMDLESNIDHVMELPQMVDHPEALFTPLFIKGILDESDTTFLRVLMENQIEGWPARLPSIFQRLGR